MVFHALESMYPCSSQFIALFPLFHNHMLSLIHLLILLDSFSQFIKWFSLLQCSDTAILRHWASVYCGIDLVLTFMPTFPVFFVCSPNLVPSGHFTTTTLSWWESNEMLPSTWSAIQLRMTADCSQNCSKVNMWSILLMNCYNIILCGVLLFWYAFTDTFTMLLG